MPENSCFKDCPHAERISSLEKDYEKMYEEKRAAHKEIYTALNSLKNDFAIANTQLGTLINQVTQMSKDVAVLKEAPAKRWDNLTKTILSSIISNIIGIIIGVIVAKGG